MTTNPAARKLAALVRQDPEIAARALRLLAAEPTKAPVILPADAAAIAQPLLVGRENEALVCVALDRRNHPIEAAVITTGGDAFTIVCPKQILRWALTRARPAGAIVIAHNHPTGDPTPSVQDDEVTRRVASACHAVGLQLVDHVVVTDDPDRWYSYMATGRVAL